MPSPPAIPGLAPAGPKVRLAFVHGLGSVLQHEHRLLAALARNPPTTTGPHAEDLARIVEHQRARLVDTVSLLKARCEMLPRPARFDRFDFDLPPVGAEFEALPTGDDALTRLVDGHTLLMRHLGALDDQRSGGDPAKPLLQEAARNHEEMAWMLMALIHENESTRDWAAPSNATPRTPASTAEANWENEGGHTVVVGSNDAATLQVSRGPH